MSIVLIMRTEKFKIQFKFSWTMSEDVTLMSISNEGVNKGFINIGDFFEKIFKKNKKR